MRGLLHSKSNNLHGRHVSICGGHKCESESVISGEVLRFPERVSLQKCEETNFKKSADAIVAQDQSEGQNL